MNRRQVCLAAAGALAACHTQRRPGAAAQSLLAGGASAMQPLVRALAQDFMRQQPGCTIVVERGGSLPALIAAQRGAIDVAAMTRPLADSEDGAGTRQFLVARGAITVVAHPGLQLAGLTQSRMRALFRGDTRNWREVGGAGLPVTVCVPPRGAAARATVEDLLLDGAACTVDAREFATDATMLAAVAATAGAIGCVAGHATPYHGAVLTIDGIPACDATILSGRYPYTCGFYLLLHGASGGPADDFVRFARSSAGQAIVARHGLVPMC